MEVIEDEVEQNEIKEIAQCLPKPPRGKRRFIDYFIKTKEKAIF